MTVLKKSPSRTDGEILLAANGLVKSLGGKRVVDGIDLTCASASLAIVECKV